MSERVNNADQSCGEGAVKRALHTPEKVSGLKHAGNIGSFIQSGLHYEWY